MGNVSITILGRASRIRYKQGSRTIDVESEPLGGTPSLVLYTGSIKAWSDGRAVTAKEKAEIVDTIRRMLRSKWGEIAVE